MQICTTFHIIPLLTIMKHSNSLQHLKKFVYVDSSEEEEERYKQEHKQSEFKVKRQCTADNEKWVDDSYRREMKQIIQDQIDKIQGGRVMLVAADDKEVQENFRMRKQKFQYFKQQMQIDERYNKLIEEKASKLREENKRKLQVLARKRQVEQMKDQQCMLKKYIIDKKDKQHIVVQRVKKTAHKLAVQRKAHTAKHIKIQIVAQKQTTQHQLHNLKAKQKNQLDELREKYELIKEEKRINRLDQEKVLRDLQKQNQRQKQQLKEVLLIKKSFQV